MMNLKKENLHRTSYSVELLLFILIIYLDEFYITLINHVNFYENICNIKYNWTSYSE